MIFRTRAASGALSPFIEHFWYYEDLAVDHTKEKLVPNSTVELIVDLSATPKRLYDNADPNRYREFRRAWISGMQREYIVIGPQVGSSMMGAHFRPGGAGPFLNFPLSELAGDVVELDLIWREEIRNLRDSLLEASTIDRKFDLLESFLSAKVRRAEQHGTLNAALQALHRAPTIPIVEVAKNLGVTQKRLINLFDSQVGCSPKFTARVFRFQKALKEIHRLGEQDWVDFAMANGYYDQSHLIHEFQAFAGVTPAQYVQMRSLYPDYIPIA